MKLSSVLVTVLGELGIGTALFVCLQHAGEIRKSFFTLQSCLTAISFLLMSIASVERWFFFSVYFPLAILAFLASSAFSNENPQWGRVILLTVAAFGAFLLAGEIWFSKPETGSRSLALANVAAGTFLFGWVNGAMILGHWYLIMRGLSFIHFQKATLQLLAAVVVRGVVFGAACLWIFLRDSPEPGILNSIMAAPLFFSMRVVWGLILPAVFSFMAWRCARTGSNQAGTGLLYIAEVSVLIGEILAGFLGL